jgi:hypothetical protein
MAKNAASFDEIGKEIGVTTERARQIFETGMNKLRQYLLMHPEKGEAMVRFLGGIRRPGPPNPKIPEDFDTGLD